MSAIHSLCNRCARSNNEYILCEYIIVNTYADCTRGNVDTLKSYRFDRMFIANLAFILLGQLKFISRTNCVLKSECALLKVDCNQ